MPKLIRFLHAKRASVAMFGTLGVLVVFVWQGMAALNRTMNKDECAARLKQIGLAMHNYHSTYDAFPPGVVDAPNLPLDRRLSWAAPVWSTLSADTKLDADPTSAWDSPRNWPLKVVPSAKGVDPTYAAHVACTPFTCPIAPARGTSPGANLSFVGITGLGADSASLPNWHERAGVFGYNRTVRFADILDGVSNTMMFAETTSGVGPITAGGPTSIRPVDPNNRPHIGRGRPFGGLHEGGAYVLLCDGSVKFAKSKLSAPTFESLATIRGGETIPGEGCESMKPRKDDQDGMPKDQNDDQDGTPEPQ